VLFLFLAIIGSSHGIGLGFAYFFPRNGTFSHPVSPLSLRDINLSFGRFFALSTSLSLISIGGMGLKDAGGNAVPTDGPVVGPFLSGLATLAGALTFPIPLTAGRLEIVAKGGVFGFYNFSPPLMTGRLDRYIASQEGHTTVTSSFTHDGKTGWGYLFGGEATWYIQERIGISIGALYYLGGADIMFGGTFNYDGSNQAALPSYLQNVQLDYTGLEVMLGGSYEL
jgi:hypothetical protein